MFMSNRSQIRSRLLVAVALATSSIVLAVPAAQASGSRIATGVGRAAAETQGARWTDCHKFVHNRE
jgi:hypothetical protein